MKTRVSGGKRGVVGRGVVALVVVAGSWLSLGGVSTRAAAEVRSAARVENPSASSADSYRIADADRDMLEQQLD